MDDYVLVTNTRSNTRRSSQTNFSMETISAPTANNNFVRDSPVNKDYDQIFSLDTSFEKDYIKRAEEESINESKKHVASQMQAIRRQSQPEKSLRIVDVEAEAAPYTAPQQQPFTNGSESLYNTSPQKQYQAHSVNLGEDFQPQPHQNALFRSDTELQCYLQATNMGFPEELSRFAVEIYCGHDIKVMDYITKYQQLSDLFPGIRDELIKEALLLTDRDINQAITYVHTNKQRL
ncbi:hypothetical protein AKO1_012412 [Acrasis kona]|uniref:CUE domain-containing protein n=1 Tax=Acrasis kona TaxID=1008807 RepID=A0AAW2YWH5_9EUKA